MGAQRQSKNIRRTVSKAQDKVISNYVREHWDTVVVSSIRLIRTFKFSARFKIALQILFPVNRKKQAEPERV